MDAAERGLPTADSAPVLDGSISLQKLEILCRVVELGTVTQAAEQLYVAQPVVTAHLQSLEEKLRVTLFERRGRTLELTPAGERVSAWALVASGRSREMHEGLAKLRAGQIGSARIGASMSIGSYRLPSVMTALLQDRPEAVLDLSTSDSEAAIRLVEEGELDFCVIELDEDPDGEVLDAELLGSEETVLVVAPSSDLGEKVSIDELATVPMVTSPHEAMRWSRGTTPASRTFSTPQVTIEFGHPEAIKAGVADGLGGALLFRSAVAKELDTGVLREVEVRDARIEAPVYAVKRRDKVLSELQLNLLERIRAEFGGGAEAEAASGTEEEPTKPFDNRINLQKLEIFCVAVELGSTGRAVERLGIGQPALAAHLRSLEQRVDAQLFLKDRRSLVLTEEGELVYHFASEILALGRAMVRELQGLEDGDRGAALIGSSVSLGSYLLPSVLAAFQRFRPQAKVTLRTADPLPTLRDVERGELDFAVVILDQHPDGASLVSELLGDEEIVLVSAAGEQPAGEEMTLDELRAIPLIGASRGSARQEMIDRALGHHDAMLQATGLAVGHPLSTLQAVLEGVGATLMSRSAAESALRQDERLRIVRLSDAQLSVPIYAVRRKDKRLSEMQRQLLDWIRSAVGKTRPQIQ